MTWVDPQVTIRGAEIGGETVDGTFVFPHEATVEYETRTQEFFQSEGQAAVVVSTVLDYIGDGESGAGQGIRQELSFDAGGGIHAITVDFSGATATPHQWGDTGDGGTPTDATGEDIHAQMAVLDKYLNSATIDSDNPAILEVGEYSAAGRYGALNVVPENPNMTFNAGEQSSVFDGSITWVETVDLSDPLDAGEAEEYA